MKCPRCKSKVEWAKSAVDDQPVRFCSNPSCDWQHPLGAEDKLHDGSPVGYFNTSTMTAKYERNYNGQ